MNHVLSTQAAAALASWSGSSRLYTLSIDGASDALLVEAFLADDALQDIGTRELIVLSTSIRLDIASLLGRAANLQVSLADGTRTHFDGEIHAVAMLGSDGGLARWRLRIASWPWRLAHARNSRSWQETSVTAIVDAVFRAYQPAARWRWSDDVYSVLRDVPVRSYCCQYRESDLDFVRRLLDEEGLCWRFEQADDGPLMVLFADSTRHAALRDDASCARDGAIRYHAAGALERQDTVQALQARRTLHVALTTLVSADYKGRRSFFGSSPTRLPVQPVLEDYDAPGQYAFGSREQGRRHADLRMEVHEAQARLWCGRSTVRTLRAGTRLVISGMPRRELGDPATFAILRVTSIGINNLPPPASQALAALFGPIPELLEQAARACWPEDLSDAIAQAVRSGYGNRFEALPAAIPWRRPCPTKPTASGSQSAIVVGPDGSSVPRGANELYCDRLGRIRIRFHWQEGTATGCWVRVAQRSAGAGMGSQFLPRIGQEVLVQFLENDIDRPIVVGALYNGRGQGGIAPTPGGAATSSRDTSCFTRANDHLPSGQGNLAGGNAPVWHGASADSAGHNNGAAQWGLRSKEFGGSGYNQLLFDDTDGQGRVQLRCTHAATELNLGHLIHSADNYRGSFRGMGAELRTDAYGAVRAGAGLLVSSYGIEHGAARRDAVGENAAGIGMLEQAVGMTAAFHAAATTHRTVGLASYVGAAQSGASVIDDNAAPMVAMYAAVANLAVQDGGATLPQSSHALLAVSAKDGFGANAGQGIQIATGEVASFVSGVDTQFVVGGRVRVNAGQAIGLLGGATSAGSSGDGLKLIAAKDAIHVQTHRDELKIQAKEMINVLSANGHIDWAAAKSISLSTEGGASILIEGGGITVQCPRKLMIKAGRKILSSPEQLDYVFPASLNLTEEQQQGFYQFDEQFHLVDRFDMPVANVRYRITSSAGEIFEGMTDAEGFTKRVKTARPVSLVVEVLGAEGLSG